MKLVLFLVCLLAAPTACADDAETNPIAKTLKQKLLKSIKNSQLTGYCDVYVEMTHTESMAIVKRVTTSGDYRLCKLSQSKVRLGQQFKFRYPEKYIRLHIEK